MTTAEYNLQHQIKNFREECAKMELKIKALTDALVLMNIEKNHIDELFHSSEVCNEHAFQHSKLQQKAIAKAILGKPLDLDEQRTICYFLDRDSYKRFVELTGIEDIYDRKFAVTDLCEAKHD